MPNGSKLHIQPTNYHLLAAQQEPYKKAYLLMNCFGEFSGEKKSHKNGQWHNRNSKKKKNGDRKAESNDSPEIPDSRHPRPPFRVCQLTGHIFRMLLDELFESSSVCFFKKKKKKSIVCSFMLKLDDPDCDHLKLTFLILEPSIHLQIFYSGSLFPSTNSAAWSTAVKSAWLFMQLSPSFIQVDTEKWNCLA